MDTSSTKPAGPLPEELMDQYHKAIDHFHEARKNLEATMAGIDHRHNERVSHAAEGVQAAEREVEEISERIGQELRSQKSPGLGWAHEENQSEHARNFEPLR